MLNKIEYNIYLYFNFTYYKIKVEELFTILMLNIRNKGFKAFKSLIKLLAKGLINLKALKNYFILLF